jgi:hypothetical protein
MKYKTRAKVVDAEQYTGVDSMERIGQFLQDMNGCGIADEPEQQAAGRFRRLTITGGPKRRQQAFLGDWIVKSEGHLVEVLSDDEFHAKYEEACD